MSNSKYDALKLENQLCFPLYAASRKVVNMYRPYLDEIGLTYTQYITMMVMWESGQISVKELCTRLMLDSGTVSPVLKSLEAKGYVVRKRSSEDERSVTVSITDDGLALRDRAVGIPESIARCVDLSFDEAALLLFTLQKLLDKDE